GLRANRVHSSVIRARRGAHARYLFGSSRGESFLAQHHGRAAPILRIVSARQKQPRVLHRLEPRALRERLREVAVSDFTGESLRLFGNRAPEKCRMSRRLKDALTKRAV